MEHLQALLYKVLPPVFLIFLFCFDYFAMIVDDLNQYLLMSGNLRHDMTLNVYLYSQLVLTTQRASTGITVQGFAPGFLIFFFALINLL